MTSVAIDTVINTAHGIAAHPRHDRGRTGHTDAHGMPSVLMRAAIFTEFKDTIRPAKAGARLFISVLVPISWALGYRSRIKKYAGRRAA